MSLPGFTAEKSLSATSSSYFGALNLATGDEDLVGPEIFGVIREAFQSIGHKLSGALVGAASALGDEIKKLAAGGHGDQPFACTQWATEVLSCNNGQPTYSQAQIMSRCVGMNPAYGIVCAAASASMYPLIQQACSQAPDQVGNLAGQVCQQ
jgi:hypothetical protein